MRFNFPYNQNHLESTSIRNVSLRQIFIELVRDGMKAFMLAFDMLAELQANLMKLPDIRFRANPFTGTPVVTSIY
jgi:hypothetical protein